MSLSGTPSGERVHIGFFGRTNAGKSSLVNAVTDQELAVISSVKGTTTDPVYKSMELLPIGPVMIIDTPGFDDISTLGELRIKKTKQVIGKTDIAVLVVDAKEGIDDSDRELIELFKKADIPYLTVYNKTDLLTEVLPHKENEIYISAKNKDGIHQLKELIGKMVKPDEERSLVKDLLHEDDFVVLVVPIDSSAPKGRLILPQQQVIRDVLEANAMAIVVKDTELDSALQSLGKMPSMVITDSQVFHFVDSVVPKNIPLTSFSILMARYKGFLEVAVKGLKAIESLKDGDIVLIAEGCTHHRQCEDIGTVKIPKWLKASTGKEISIETVSGREFPEDLSKYAMVIHCGGCMLNAKEMQTRMKKALEQGVAFTNYGVIIAYMNGILDRSLSVFDNN